MNREPSTRSLTAPVVWLPILCAVGLSAGCDRSNVEVYSVPKESAPSHSSQAPGMPENHPTMGAVARPGIKYQLPEGWQEGVPSSMRAASFKVTSGEATADVAVIPLPPGGSDLDLVNMWRSEVQLPPTTSDRAAAESTRIPMGSESATFYELASADATPDGTKLRILVAMLNRDRLNWFFKMKGEDALVRDQKERFLAFLKSVEFTETPMQTVAATHSHGPMAGAHNDGKPHWNVPSGWQEVPGGQFLVAKFNITAENGTAAVNVSASGGGWLANVNRWRQQLGLEQVDDSGLSGITSELDVSAGKASMTDLTGKDAQTGQLSRSIGIMVPQPGQPFYYRLVGTPDVVEREKEAFLRFVQTADYSHAH